MILNAKSLFNDRWLKQFLQVIKKPENMSDEEAAGLLYTGLTVWCALKFAGGLYILNAYGKSVLVIGGSGGVGNCAIQLLKSWGAKVGTVEMR